MRQVGKSDEPKSSMSATESGPQSNEASLGKKYDDI